MGRRVWSPRRPAKAGTTGQETERDKGAAASKTGGGGGVAGSRSLLALQQPVDHLGKHEAERLRLVLHVVERADDV